MVNNKELDIVKFVNNCDYHRRIGYHDECIDHCDFTRNSCIITSYKSGDSIPDICNDSQREEL